MWRPNVSYTGKNTYYKQRGFKMQSQLFFLLSWVENMHGLSTSLSELWSLEIGIIKEANVTRGLWGVLVGLPACECPFITRLVKISRGRRSCTFPHYCRRPVQLPFIVHDCMETALLLKAHRMGGLVDHGSPDNTTWLTLNLIRQLEANHAHW